LLLFLSGIVTILLKLIKSIKNNVKDFYFFLFTFSFLIALQVYAQIESWWIGIGAAPLPIFFVLAGVISNIGNNNQTVQT